MVDPSNSLRRPIDVVHLIHKALRVMALRVEKEAEHLDALGGLHSFNLVFNTWVTNLITLTELKREHMRGDSVNASPGGRARKIQMGNALPQTDALEPESAVSAPDVDPAEGPLLALEEELMGSVQAVMTVLSDEIGKTSVITRTKQHVQQQVMALRFVQEDHFETEEALVLPTIRDNVTERRQLQMARSLLIDEGADDPRWIIDWVASELEPSEQRQLADLEARFSRLTD